MSKLMKCVGCGRFPNQIDEYINLGKVEDPPIGGNAYCFHNEGTLNRETGEFACTECYIKMGEPLGTATDNWTLLM